jgi:hypothetical protein
MIFIKHRPNSKDKFGFNFDGLLQTYDMYESKNKLVGRGWESFKIQKLASLSGGEGEFQSPKIRQLEWRGLQSPKIS